MKKILAFLLILFSVIFVGCDFLSNNLISLDSPSNVCYEDNVLSWDNVPNAIGYKVKVNGNEEFSEINRIAVGLNSTQDITVEVQAVPKINDLKYKESFWSKPKKFNCVYDSNIRDMDEYIIMKNYILGNGINTITGDYFDYNNETVKINDFVDKKKLSSLYDIEVLSDAQSSTLETIDSENITNFVDDFSLYYLNSNAKNLGLNNKDKVWGFPEYLNKKFFIENDFNLNKNTQSYYNVSYKTIIDKRIAIKHFNAQDAKETGIISDYALSKINDIYINMKDYSESQLKAEIESIFDEFGTHIITDAVYGGKIEFAYSILTNSNDLSIDYGTLINENINQILNKNNDNFNNKYDSEIDEKLKINVKDDNTYTNFIAQTYGGRKFQATSFDEFNKLYNSWINDYDLLKGHRTLIDISNGGLCPIWELLPNEYYELALKMKEIFEKELSTVDDEFVMKFIYDPYGPENHVDFDGGNGSAEKPYRISNYDQLQKIGDEKYKSKENHMNHFILTDDIDLTNVSCFYSIANFNGSLDGDGHSIIGWKDPSNNGNPGDYGQRGFILNNRGEIKNLTMRYNSQPNLADKDSRPTCISFSYEGAKKYKIDKRIFTAGVLVSSNKESGKIINCHVTGAKISIYQYYKDLGGYLSLKVGALVGENHGEVQYCSSYNNVVEGYNLADYQDGGSNVYSGISGLVGWNHNKVNKCLAHNNYVYSYMKGGYTWALYHYNNNYAADIIGINTGNAEYTFSYGSNINIKHEVFSGKPVIIQARGSIVGYNEGNVQYHCQANSSLALLGMNLKDKGKYGNLTTLDNITEICNISPFKDFLEEKNGSIVIKEMHK